MEEMKALSTEPYMGCIHIAPRESSLDVVRNGVLSGP